MAPSVSSSLASVSLMSVRSFSASAGAQCSRDSRLSDEEERATILQARRISEISGHMDAIDGWGWSQMAASRSSSRDLVLIRDLRDTLSWNRRSSRDLRFASNAAVELERPNSRPPPRNAQVARSSRVGTRGRSRRCVETLRAIGSGCMFGHREPGSDL